MINVYCNMQAGENHLLGFIFFQFAGDYWVNDYKKFNNALQANHYLDGSKKDLLIINLEQFKNEFRLGRPAMTELERDALDKIRNGVAYLIEHKDHTRILYHADIVKKLGKFMKVLVRSTSRELQSRHYMMYQLIQNYCDTEIQNSGQAPV